MYDTAIYIGRFEPVHSGHLALLRQALASAPRVIVVVGSARQARTPRNPFTAAEREAMLREPLPEADRARLQVLAVRDHYDEAAWAHAVRCGVAALSGPEARIGLVGHFKDTSSSYLNAFPGWELVRMERQGGIDATAIRDAFFGAAPERLASALAGLADQMPASTLRFLQSFAEGPHYAALQDEWRLLREQRAAWASAPYPPTFVTVDALVRAQGQVLLIRRGRGPGKGLLALPGGFIDVHETLLQSCLRELAEETHCAVSAAALAAALREVRVFAHPARSQRGRTITHVHCFDLGDAPPPAVRADDDAALAHWLPTAELAGLEEQFFDDHFHILDRFLGLLPAPGAAQ